MKKSVVIFISAMILAGLMCGYGFADKGEQPPEGYGMQGPAILGTFVVDAVSPTEGAVDFEGHCKGFPVTIYDFPWDHPSVITEENTENFIISSGAAALPPECLPPGASGTEDLIINTVIKFTKNTEGTFVTFDAVTLFLVAR
jgi:hypothetical protein